MNRAAWESYEDELLRAVKHYCNDSEIDRVQEAVTFGALAHDGQMRASGEPYFTHPLAVAALVAKVEMPVDGVIAAVLHDVLEDCDIGYEELRSRFGERVATLVEGVSKLKAKNEKSRVESDALSLKRLVLSSAKDPLALVIKIADRVHNVSTLGAMAQEKQMRIAKQTQEIYLPLAQRLGLYSWAESLEEQCLQITRPNTYRVLSEAMQKNYNTRKRRSAFASFTSDVQKALDSAGIKASVISRLKKVPAVYKKIKKTDKHLTNIQDIFGIRIIVEDRPSCYQALGVIHSAFKPKYDELKDYIAVPKANKYQSIHTKINHEVLDVVDVQIRDKKMDDVAANGIAAHWKYKGELDKNYARFIRQLSEFEITDEVQQYSEQISESLKSDDTVIVYSPKNDVTTLPAGSTALDFAYHIHTEIGARAIKAEINGREASIFTKLNKSDVVRIKTSKLARPRAEWLNHVVSSRARNAIKVQLRDRNELLMRFTGRKLIRDILIKYKIDNFDLSSEERQQVANTHGVANWPAVVAGVGRGTIDVNKLVYDIIFSKGLVDGEPIDHESRIILQGEAGKDFMSCPQCTPIPGDLTKGVLMPDRGLVVHGGNCTALTEAIENGVTQIKTQWGDTGDNRYPTALYVETVNKPRVLASLASTIADSESNIEAVSVIERNEEIAQIFFKIMVTGRKQLADIMRGLRATELVLSITRSRPKIN